MYRCFMLSYSTLSITFHFTYPSNFSISNSFNVGGPACSVGWCPILGCIVMSFTNYIVLTSCNSLISNFSRQHRLECASSCNEMITGLGIHGTFSLYIYRHTRMYVCTCVWTFTYQDLYEQARRRRDVI